MWLYTYENLDEKSFAGLLRTAREASTDPLTGTHYTQLRLGELLGVSDAIISRWETGLGCPKNEAVLNRLPELLPSLDLAEILRSLGYRLPLTVGLSPEEREVLQAYRSIDDPAQRERARRLLLLLSPAGLAQPPPRKRRGQ